MFKRTVDVDEVRNGEVIRGSSVWLYRRGGWMFGIALMPHADDPKRRPNDCEWGCICECPQGEKHLIPDDVDDLRALRDSMEPGVLLTALGEVVQFVDRVKYSQGMSGVGNDEMWTLADWLNLKCLEVRES